MECREYLVRNPRIGGIQKRTAWRGVEEMRWRGEVVIADAWVALRSPPITHQSRAGDPSGARARRPVRRSAAFIRHDRHSRIHVRDAYTGREKKRERQGEACNTVATIVRACVRACEIRIICHDTCTTRGKKQRTHTGIVWHRVQRVFDKRTPVLQYCFGVIGGEMWRANK